MIIATKTVKEGEPSPNIAKQRRLSEPVNANVAKQSKKQKHTKISRKTKHKKTKQESDSESDSDNECQSENENDELGTIDEEKETMKGDDNCDDKVKTKSAKKRRHTIAAGYFYFSFFFFFFIIFLSLSKFLDLNF